MSEERVYLWEQTRGLKDEQIMNFVRTLSGGKPVTFIELILAILPEELDPDKARNCVIGFEITADDKMYPCRIEIKDGEVYAERGDPGKTDATIACSLATFIRIVNEDLGGVKAFLLGKIWVKGDPVFAYSLPQMFPFRERHEAQEAMA